MVKNPPATQETQEMQVLSWEDPLEEEMATRSSTLARKIPSTEEPGVLQSTWSQRVKHDQACVHACTRTFSSFSKAVDNILSHIL